MNVVKCGAFLTMLYRLMPESLVAVLAISALDTAVTTLIIGPPLRVFTFSRIEAEADLRAALMRAQQYAEEIVLFRGGDRELARCQRQLDGILGIQRSRRDWDAGCGVYRGLVDWVTNLVPTLLIAPAYFRGDVEFGAITKVGIAYGTVRSGFMVIANNIANVASVAVSAGRVSDLLTLLAETKAEAHAASLRLRRSDLPLAGLERSYARDDHVIALAPGMLGVPKHDARPHVPPGAVRGERRGGHQGQGRGAKEFPAARFPRRAQPLPEGCPTRPLALEHPRAPRRRSAEPLPSRESARAAAAGSPHLCRPRFQSLETAQAFFVAKELFKGKQAHKDVKKVRETFVKKAGEPAASGAAAPGPEELAADLRRKARRLQKKFKKGGPKPDAIRT